MDYHGKFGHAIGRIQHISLIIRVVICYATCRLETQTVAPTIPCFQVIKGCVQYLASHPHKPIFYPYISYYGSKIIILTWSGNQVKYYTTQNCLELHQDADHAIILNKRWSVSGILHTLLGVSVCWKVNIHPDIVSDPTDG